MKRRQVLTAGLGLLLDAGARANQMLLAPQGPLRAFVSQPTRILQECPMFCWAASIAMIFADAGHPTDQLRIVKSVYPNLQCRGANGGAVITQALSHPWTDDDGDTFDPEVTAGYDFFNRILAIDNAFIVNELQNDRPLLYANQSHCMVIAVCDFAPTPFGPNILAVGVIDPYPRSPGFHGLSPSEMVPAHLGGSMTYLASVSI